MKCIRKNSNGKDIILVVPINRTHYVVPPIGLGYLATALRKSGFSDVTILDCLKERLNFSNLKRYFSEWQPRVVGFQIFSYDFPSVVKSISLLKEVSPKTVVIIGGPHVSAVGPLALEEIAQADFGFIGEGEIGLPLLLHRILKGEAVAFTDIPGLLWREGPHVRANPRVFIQDLDSIGFPAWDLMPPASYPDSPQGVFYKNFPIAPIATTRGCPYHCTFCGSAVNMGHALRLRKMQYILDEMSMLCRDYGVREFHIIDDMFNFDKQRVMDFCHGIRQRKLNISYTFPNGLRLNHLDRESLLMMKDTGAYAFTVGVESGSQRILDAMRKGLTLELIQEKINLICDVGLEPSGFFIIGYPQESVADVLATIAFAKKLKIKRAHFSNFLPLPGTQATQVLQNNGEINHVDWGSLCYSSVPYVPIGMTKKQLKRMQRRAFLEFHLRPHILIKMLTEIRSFGHLRIISLRIIDYLFG